MSAKTDVYVPGDMTHEVWKSRIVYAAVLLDGELEEHALAFYKIAGIFPTKSEAEKARIIDKWGAPADIQAVQAMVRGDEVLLVCPLQRKFGEFIGRERIFLGTEGRLFRAWPISSREKSRAV